MSRFIQNRGVPPMKQSKKNYTSLFGPVPSRRLGVSLGVDLIPFKTCGFDCIFCQLGRTTNKTLDRREYISTDLVMNEITDWLKVGAEAHYITFSGSGEPTLHARFGDIIDGIRRVSSIPIALLTNGATLIDPDVREQAALADVVKVSLCAWDQFSLARIHRPHPDVTFKKLMEGIWLFKTAYQGELWLEVFIIPGINNNDRDVALIAELIAMLSPTRVQLNTAVRPACEPYVFAESRPELERLAAFFEPKAEVIANYSGLMTIPIAVNEVAIYRLLQRRPCTLEQVSHAFGLHQTEIAKYLGKMLQTDRVRKTRRSGDTYFFASQDE